MIRNRDFAMLYAGRAVFTKENEFAGVVVGWNDMHGVILGVEHVDGWQSWGANDIGVSEEEFTSYEYRNAGTLAVPGELAEEEAPKHKTIGELAVPGELAEEEAPKHKTIGELAEEEAPKHKTIGELIKKHEGVSGIQFSTDGRGNVQAAYIRGKHGGMKLVSLGDGLENVSSKI